MKKKVCKCVLIVIAMLFACMQFVPVQRTNPPVTGEIQVPQAVMHILKKACYDCHSNETVWPWYSAVAPFSWLVESDVKDGRGHMNFSMWNEYSQKNKFFKQTLCGKLVAIGEMPLWFYVPLHPDAKLTPEEIDIIVEWSKEAE